MNVCTIMEFQNAILHPKECLHSMRDMYAEHETFTRTKYFAECRAELRGEMFMVYAPITTVSLDMAQQANMALPTESKHIGRVQIIEQEMLCVGIESHLCPLLIEPLPKGVLLSEAIYTHRCDHLLQGLEELRAELSRYNISTNHLNTNCIIVDSEHHWHIIRPYYTTRGTGGDDTMFDSLRELIMQNSLGESLNYASTLNEAFASYTTIKDGNRTLYPASEGRRRFTTTSGTGFEDEHGNIVIEAKFLTASDFTEDRAIVQSHNHKWGVIDRRGKYIIDMLYDSLDFDMDYGTSKVTLNGRTATFDYLGTQLTPWE